MRTFNAAIILGASSLLPACATVVRGTDQDISIVSEPPEALARLSNGMSCTTPCKVELDRREDVTVTVSKAGYQPSETKIVSKMRGSDYLLGIGGNIMAGGIIGAVVDGSNGALYSLEPSPLHVKLQPWGASIAQPAPQYSPVPQLQPQFSPAPQPQPNVQYVSAAPVTAQVAMSGAGVPVCAGIPGVPAGVSTYSIADGRGGFILICDDPARR